jgi:hypothetical protein
MEYAGKSAADKLADLRAKVSHGLMKYLYLHV